MKNILIIALILFSFNSIGQVISDSQLLVQDSLDIRNKKYDPLLAYKMHKGIINSKVNRTPNFLWDQSSRNLAIGNGNINSQGHDNFLMGLNSAIAIGSWNVVFGESNSITRPSGNNGVGDNAILSGFSNEIRTTIACPFVGTFETTILGGYDNKSIDGTQCTILGGNHNLVSNRSATTFGEWGEASGYGAFSHGLQDNAGHTITPPPTQRVLAAGKSAFNFSMNNNKQIVGHGALADRSFILNTKNGNVPSDSPGSGILGGFNIKARANDSSQVYVPNFNINSTPLRNDTLSQVLVRDNTSGQIKFRKESPVIKGQFSQVGTSTEIFTVTIGSTMANTNFTEIITPTNGAASSLWYVTNKTTSSFDVVFLSALTGPVTFDWTVFP